ncbi:MAG: hypothetical protein ACYC0B_02185 [Gemmatimonadaceae bacterium]
MPLPARPREHEPDLGNGRLEYQASPPATYYVASNGDRWRIYDCVFEDGKHRRVALESNEATFRIFVAPPASGVRKVYRRQRRERFVLSPAACERQLKESEYLGSTGAFNSAERTAR